MSVTETPTLATITTGPAVKVYEGTDINRLAVHVIDSEGRAICNQNLRALFIGNDEVTCKRCLAATDL